MTDLNAPLHLPQEPSCRVNVTTCRLRWTAYLTQLPGSPKPRVLTRYSAESIDISLEGGLNIPGTSFAPYLHKKSELTVEGGCVLWGGLRVVIPDSCRGRLLSQLHRDHPGICKMKSIAHSYMWWPEMDDGIVKLAKSYQDCHAIKNAPPVAQLHPWEWPSCVFQCLHIDYAGPFQGEVFLVAVDAYSKWPMSCSLPPYPRRLRLSDSCLLWLVFLSRLYRTMDLSSCLESLQCS